MPNSPADKVWKRFVLFFGGTKGGLILAAFILVGECLTFLLMPESDLAGFLWVTIHFVVGPVVAVAFILVTMVKLFMVNQWTTRLSCLLIPLPVVLYLYMAVTGDPRWTIWLMPFR